MTASNAWDLPPKNIHGDADERMIFASVGEALTNWERLDAEMGMLFNALVNQNSIAAFRAYGIIEGFSNRKKMVEAVIEATFNNDDFGKSLKLILNEAGHFSARRNDIAHGIVAVVKDRGWYLLPNFTSSRKIELYAEYPSQLPFKYMLVSEQIDEFTKHFNRIRTQIFYLRKVCEEKCRELNSQGGAIDSEDEPSISASAQDPGDEQTGHEGSTG